jgi:hypothetical protein
MTGEMKMDKAVKEAFSISWEDCTEEQKELRRKHLPTRNYKIEREDYSQMLIDRYNNKLPMSKDAIRQVKQILKNKAV